MDKRHKPAKNNNKMVQEEQQLRQLFQQIYEKKGRKILPKQELIKALQQKGYTPKQAEQLIYKAAEHKILQSGLDVEIDPQTGKVLRDIIVYEYMTEEDWEIEKALDEIEDEIYHLKKQLHPEEY